jgi:Predicted membrane protein
VIYLAWVWLAVWRLDPGTTARLAKREDPSSAVAELVVVSAGIAMLVAVGFALARAGQATSGMKAFLVTLGLLSVVLSWTIVHTVYALRYARAYYSEPTAASSSTRKNRRRTRTSPTSPSPSG